METKILRKMSGFTLIELLVSISLLAVLASLSFSASLRAIESVRRVTCMNNLKQLALAASLYADEDAQGVFLPQLNPNDRSLAWMHNRFISSRDTFVCPSTRNSIRQTTGLNPNKPGTGIVDLFDLASGKDGKYGTSYMQMGWMAWRTPQYTEIIVGAEIIRVGFVRKTLNSVLTYRHYWDAFGLRGHSAGPANIWLFNDFNMNSNPHFPDSDDNHGEAGSNVAFADGHVAWISAEKYVFSYELSQDDNRTGINFWSQE